MTILLAAFDQGVATALVTLAALVVASFLAAWSAWNRRKNTDDVARIEAKADIRVKEAESETRARDVITKEYRDEISRLRDRLDKFQDRK